MMYCSLRRTRQGTTLVELMIASGLLLIVLTLVTFLIRASSRQFLVMDASLDLQRESVLAANWLTREMAESNENSIHYFPPASGTEAIVIGSPRTFTGGMQYTNGGALVWQKKVCFYLSASNNGRALLERIEKPLTPYKTTYPPSINPSTDTVANFQANTTFPKRLIAKDVDRIELDVNVRPVQLTLELSSTKHGKPFRATIQSKVHFRN